MVTVGIVQVASDLYRDWLVPWAESVASLSTQPDRIVVVCQSQPPALPVSADVVLTRDPFSWSGWLNVAVASCPTDWVAWIGVDDAYRPHALDGVDESDADVVAFGMQFERGSWNESVDAGTVLTSGRNHVPVGSPFRRCLWERIPFNTRYAPFEDWAFWISCAAQGAKFSSTGRIDFDYRWHPDTPQATERDVEAMRAWAVSLGSSSHPPAAPA